MIKATSIKWDTTPLPKRYTDSKKVKQCLKKTQVKGFFFFLSFIFLEGNPSLNQFLPLCITKISCFLSPQSNSMKGSLWSAKLLYKSFFFSFLWWKPVLSLLGSRSKRDINWTTRLPFMSCRRRCDIWTVCVCEWGGGVQHAIHCWVDFFSSSSTRLYRASFKICQVKSWEAVIQSGVYTAPACRPVIAMH